jgi:RNA polymerase sigma-70 factor, ECF subfamily
MKLQQRKNPRQKPDDQFRQNILALIPHLRAFARNLCRGADMAEDLAQETLVKAWRSQHGFEPGTNLKAWLFTILRNEFYSQRRRNWRQTHWDEVKAGRIATPPDPQFWALQLSDTERGLRDLPDGQREALILIAAAGFSYEEAAEICGTAIGTMKSRVARGRLALADILDGKTNFAERDRRMVPSDTILAQLSALTPAGASCAAYA